MALVVLSFDAPEGVLVPTVQLDGMFVANFNVAAEFAATDDACGAGEYRQYVRGEFRVENRRIPKLVCVGRELRPDIFQEDGCAYPGPPPNADPSIVGAYGYRANGSGNNPRRPEEDYTPGSQNGCNYWMADSPGLFPAAPPPPRQLTYTVDLYFRGDLIDVLTGQTLQSKSWRVFGQTTVSGDSAALSQAAGLEGDERIIAVTARRDKASGMLDVHVDIARPVGRPPFDMTGIAVTLRDDAGHAVPAGEPLAAELVGSAGGRITLIYPVQPGARTPASAQIVIGSAISEHKIATNGAERSP